jgi:hypothetical protein
MAPKPQPPWQYSEGLGGFFVYRPSTDSIILQNGHEFARPAQIDAASLEHASCERRQPDPGIIGQPGRQSGQAVRSRGRAQYRGQGRGERGRGQVPLGHVGPNPYHNDARLAGYQQPLQPQAWNVTSSPPHVPQTTPDEQGIVSGMDGMSLFPQATSTRDWQQSQSFTGLTKGFDPDTQVQTLVQKSRPELVTPPELWKEGIRARQRLIDTQSGDSEKLDPSFSIRPGTFFSVGRVFKVLWAEPAGGNATVITRNTFKNLFGERVHSKVRWFVVIRKGTYYCGALPIATYGGKGVAKRGVVKSEHGIIYTGKNIPIPDRKELPTALNEEGMRSEPIQVDPDSPIDRLDPKSRINFAAVSTVHHNIKVKSMGKVNQKSIRVLLQHFHNVWFAPRPGSSRNLYSRNQQGSAAATRAPRSSGASDGIIEEGNDEGNNEGDEESNDEGDGEDAAGGAGSESSDEDEDGGESEGDEN